ncbi:MAG: tRNA dihydrouridine synthase [Lachnospiraceae bacterium]
MNIQMAPLEGITTYIYRNAYNKYFTPADRYYIPFIGLSGEKKFSYKEKAELAAENNRNMVAIPQVITNSSEDFLNASGKFKDMGYDEININLGCPSGTVVHKGRGSGMLLEPEKLDRFLNNIFEKTTVKVSVKTRIGYENPHEWEKLLEIYNRYPISQLIIHPRVREDFYKNKPHMEAFAYAVGNSKNPLCYNGDIYTLQDYINLKEAFPNLEEVMLGRGLLRDPFLVERIHAWDNYRKENGDSSNSEIQDSYIPCSDILDSYICDVVRLEAFHDEIYSGYKKIMSGDRNLLFKMKELWHYMVHILPDAEIHDKKIKKMNHCNEYLSYVKNLFAELKQKAERLRV